jgi:tryptophanase
MVKQGFVDFGSLKGCHLIALAQAIADAMQAAAQRQYSA